MSELRDTGLAALGFARRVSDRLLEGFDDTNALTRCGPSGCHVMHIVGHVAVTDESFLTMLGGHEPALDARYGELFGMNAEPTDHASDYPGFEEVKAAMAGRRESLIAWFTGMDDEALRAELPEPVSRFAKTHAVLMSTLAFHEGFHMGQVSAARRVLGLPRALG